MQRRVPFIMILPLTIGLMFGMNRSFAEKPAEADSCVTCHGNLAKMRDLGFPQFTMTDEETTTQTGMPAACTGCHAGNPRDQTKEGAHSGLLRLYYVKARKLEAVTRDKLDTFRPETLQPRGKNPMTEFLPMVEKDGKLSKDPEASTILFHDKNPEDLSFNHPVQDKTCAVCHPREVQEFRKTAMGHNAKQRLYKTWTDTKVGPHNCGVWFADGYEDLAKNTRIPFTKEAADINQKACNICHAGCLDCHYTPKKKDRNNLALGPHTFSRNVSAQECYGGGRGSLCHAGPGDRRRGGGFVGGEYSNPRGATPDIHYTRGIGCIDCHDTPARDKTLLHGQVKRQAGCSRCHEKSIKSVARSVHRNVSCEACHIQDAGAYAATFWGPGKLAGVKTPFFKYKEYYGVMREPVIIKSQRGKWIPVKPYPMAVLNQKSAGGLKPGLAWRFPVNVPDLERTDDAYAFVGLLSGLPTNDDVLAWIQMDKLSHKYGKARGCESCHSRNGEQRQEVLWKYGDQGAEPFEGRHVVVANKSGLFINDMRAGGEIKVQEGWRIEDFAPWYYLKDKWQVKGDFSVPPVRNGGVYKKEKERYQNILAKAKEYHK